MKVHDMRLSFLWNSTNLYLLEHAEAPFATVANRAAYVDRFEQVRAGVPDSAGFLPPWPQQGRQLFWRTYLERRDPTTITGEQAWRALVPLRTKPKITIESPVAGATVKLHVFIFPFGFTVVVDVTCWPASPLEFDAAIEFAHEIRRTTRFNISGLAGPLAHVTLDGLAEVVRGAVRTQIYGGQPQADEIVGDAYSVTTFVRLEGADTTTPVADQGEVHRALHAVTTWSPTYSVDALKPLQDARVETRTAPASHLLYAQKCGRAVWFPFTADVQRRGISLACYHRNQVFAALQVESLSMLINETERRIHSGEPISARHDSLARSAAGILGRMYGGDQSTYRTGSVRQHLVYNKCIDALDVVRDRYSMPKIIR
ncbi:MAG: hypothetical protein WC700_09885 [Gemmatimonadaceae bacterium]|jgi:hypothetical protein